MTFLILMTGFIFGVLMMAIFVAGTESHRERIYHKALDDIATNHAGQPSRIAMIALGKTL